MEVKGHWRRFGPSPGHRAENDSETESPVGPVPVLGSPLQLSDSPARFDPIPALGQDTEPILRELGYSDADVEKLRRDQII